MVPSLEEMTYTRWLYGPRRRLPVVLRQILLARYGRRIRARRVVHRSVARWCMRYRDLRLHLLRSRVDSSDPVDIAIYWPAGVERWYTIERVDAEYWLVDVVGEMPEYMRIGRICAALAISGPDTAYYLSMGTGRTRASRWCPCRRREDVASLWFRQTSHRIH